MGEGFSVAPFQTRGARCGGSVPPSRGEERGGGGLACLLPDERSEVGSGLACPLLEERSEVWGGDSLPPSRREERGGRPARSIHAVPAGARRWWDTSASRV